MSTKVRGDKIKEGSIPFEALDESLNSVPALKYFVKKLDENDLGKDIEIPYTSSIVLYYGNNIITMNDGDSKDFQSYGPSSKITLSVRQGSSYVILSVSNMGTPSLINAYGFRIYKDINKIKKEFLPDDIGGADWNAKEGEAGYIKHRPFGFITPDGIIEMQIEDINEGVIYYKPGYLGDVIHIKCDEDIDLNCFDDFCEILDSHNLFIHYPKDITSQVVILVDDVEEIYLNIEFIEDISAYIVNLDCSNSSDFTADILKDKIKIFIYDKQNISQHYLPDTVLKTTPQELSTNDKNQALANLGIDPVVWKYMMNPFVIKIEGEDCYVPEELVDLDSLFNSGSFGRVYTWKYLIPAMYVGYDDMDAKYFAVTYGEPDNDVPTLGFNGASIYINEEFKVVY